MTILPLPRPSRSIAERFPAAVAALFLTAAVIVPSNESLADPLNLERGLPLEVEDAYVAPLWNREYQSYLRYTRSGEEDDVLDAVQRLEVGVWYNTQLTVEAPFQFGEGTPDGYGATPVELLYNLNQETRTLPAVTAGGAVVAPSGSDSRGLDSRAELILTKTVPDTWTLHRVHLNGSYYFNDDREPDERPGTYKVVFGYEARASNPLVLVADVFREEQLERGRALNLVEVGGRYRLTPYALVTAGVGTGFGADAPEFRGATGLQVDFYGW